jgi:hypothetical protein
MKIKFTKEEAINLITVALNRNNDVLPPISNSDDIEIIEQSAALPAVSSLQVVNNLVGNVFTDCICCALVKNDLKITAIRMVREFYKSHGSYISLDAAKYYVEAAAARGINNSF